MPRIAPQHCEFCLEEEVQRLLKEKQKQDPEIDESKVRQLFLNVNAPHIAITTNRCLKCTKSFCSDHSSPVDQVDCCVACLPFEDISEMKTPLVDIKNGENHIYRKGFRLVPTGPGYKSLPKAIGDMDEDALRQFIIDKANQIHAVEKQRDFLRAARSTAQLELSEREAAVSRQLRQIRGAGAGFVRDNASNAPTIKITGNKKTNGSGAKGVNASAVGTNINLADFLKFAAARKAGIGSGNAPASAAAGAAKPQSGAPLREGASPAVPSVSGSNPDISKNERKFSESVNGQSNTEGGCTDKPLQPPQIAAVPLPQAPKVLSKEEVAEQAREAEIEKILEGGEPTK